MNASRTAKLFIGAGYEQHQYDTGMRMRGHPLQTDRAPARFEQRLTSSTRSGSRLSSREETITNKEI